MNWIKLDLVLTCYIIIGTFLSILYGTHYLLKGRCRELKGVTLVLLATTILTILIWLFI